MGVCNSKFKKHKGRSDKKQPTNVSIKSVNSENIQELENHLISLNLNSKDKKFFNP